MRTPRWAKYAVMTSSPGWSTGTWYARGGRAGRQHEPHARFVSGRLLPVHPMGAGFERGDDRGADGLLGRLRTVHRVLARHGLNRLDRLDRPTAEPIRRYEHDQPGDLVHVDIKKLGKLPGGGGGWRAHGRGSDAHRASRRVAARGGRVRIGYDYVHSAVDDHSRLAYSEILPDETAASAVSFWTRAQAFFTAHGITVHRVLTDNGSCYRSREFGALLVSQNIKHKRTRPYRPQTNGKVERFNRTLLAEWAYVRTYPCGASRTRALRTWLHRYNHHRCHTALGGQPPVSRVTNVPGFYI